MSWALAIMNTRGLSDRDGTWWNKGAEPGAAGREPGTAAEPERSQQDAAEAERSQQDTAEAERFQQDAAVRLAVIMQMKKQGDKDAGDKKGHGIGLSE